jgi:uncharacterized membrane protein
MKKIIVSFTISFVLLCFGAIHVSAQSTAPQMDAIVSRIIEEKDVVVMEKKQLYQKIELTITDGPDLNKKIIIENGTLPLANAARYKLDDRVLVSEMRGADGKTSYYIADFIRRDSLVLLFFIFVMVTVVIARKRGLLSLIGMAVSFLVIFFIILPPISAGKNPVSIAIIGSCIIIPFSFLLSHGANKKTGVAILGTLISLIITGLLAAFFVDAAHLTGFTSEEAGFLQVAKQGTINMKGLLLAGIIIGALGVLDDITISQSAIVFQLHEVGKKLSFDELYKKAMQVGQDHISSMVNTLVLVYTGAALPLLLIFINNPHPFANIVNYEIIADEIVRTLVGSIGLVLAVPITTFIAVLVVKNIDIMSIQK